MLGYQPDEQDAPLSDEGDMQYFNYEAYVDEGAKCEFQAQGEGGGEMWYDAESQPLDPYTLQDGIPNNEARYEAEQRGLDYNANAQWQDEMAQFGDELVGMYNDETWQHTPAPAQSDPAYSETPLAYAQTGAQDLVDATSTGEDHEILRQATNHGMIQQQGPNGVPADDLRSGAQRDDYRSDEDHGEDDDEDGDEKILAAAYQNYYTGNLLRSGLVPALPADYIEESADPAGLTSLESLVSLDELNSNERWEIDKESAAFLNHVVIETNKDYTDLLLQSAQTSLRELKVKEPVLLTDPQLDMMKIMERSKLELKAEDLNPHKLNHDNDEGLKWPAKYANLPAQLHQKIDSERLILDVETIEYLKDIHDGPDIDLDIWLDNERKLRVCALTGVLQTTANHGQAKPQYVSPKLLPLSPSYSPPQLPLSMANVPLLSTPEDPNEREVAELDKMLREKDEAAMRQLAEDSTYSSLDTGSSSSPLYRKAKRITSLKVSDPVLPAENLEPPTKKQKTVTFPDELYTLIPRPTSSDIDTIDAVDETFAAVEEILKPLAAPALEQHEHEVLDDVDTTIRVAIPDVEVISPTLPWLEGNDDKPDPRRARLIHPILSKTLDELVKFEKKWSGVSKLERDLPWSAFASHLGKIRAEPDFDDGSAARYLAELDDGDVDLESLTYRPMKLQLLTIDEFDDDELEPLDFEDEDDEQQMADSDVLPATSALLMARLTKNDIISAVHQRPSQPPLVKPKVVLAELAESSAFEVMLRKRKEELALTKMDITETERATVVPTHADPRGEDTRQAILGGGLTQHMNMHGISKASAQPASASIEPDRAPAYNPYNQKQRPVEQTAVVPPTTSVPLPMVPRMDMPLPVVVSSTIMKANQQLVRGIQKLLPTIEIIERHYSAVAVTPQKTAVAGMEAEITVSPSTGLMFTNLQRLKQKPLPGQTSHFGFCEQITVVAPRYERLIVLVSGVAGGSSNETILPALDESDTSALTDFISFGTTLDCEVEVIYTAGGNAELVDWTAATIAQHARGHSSFLPEETTWERFLRKAGFNTYAAQVLLDQLKPTTMAPYSDRIQTRSSLQQGPSGLSAFVAMSAEERLYRFADVLGGVGVLKRVCETIDGLLIPAR